MEVVMFRNALKASFVLCLMLVLGCATTKVLELNSMTVPKSYDGTTFTQKEVGKIIKQSLSERGWAITKASSGLIDASIVVRTRYHAKIKIKFNASTYSINYVDSEGLDYDEGNINRGYNHWVECLNRSIRKNLLTKTNQR